MLLKKKNPFSIGILAGVVLAVGYSVLSSLFSYMTQEGPKQDLGLHNLNFLPVSPPKKLPNLSYLHFNSEGKLEKKPLTVDPNKITVLHFWSTSCHFCISEMPSLEEFSKKHSNLFDVIMIVSDEGTKSSAELIKTFYKKHSIKNLGINFDPGIANSTVPGLHQYFSITRNPTTVFINGKGEEIGVIHGALNWTGPAGDILVKKLPKFNINKKVKGA